MPVSTPLEGPPSRRTLVRDLIVFQVKLWAEGFKDVALMPLSLAATVIDLVFRRSTRRGTLYSVMKAGNRFEKWVDLYGALDETGNGRADHLGGDEALEAFFRDARGKKKAERGAIPSTHVGRNGSTPES